MAIYDSDLVSLGKDFSPGLEREYFPEQDRSHKGRLAINSGIFESVIKSGKRFEWESYWPWPIANPMFFAHATYDQLVQMRLIPDGMPSFATIRHPVDRFLSVWSFLLKGLRSMGKEYEAVYANASPETKKYLNMDANEFWDAFMTMNVDKDMQKTPLIFVKMFRKPQTFWGNQDTEFWAIENIDRDLSKLFKDKGVEEIKVRHLKKDGKNKKRELLTLDRQQAIIDTFQTDFVTWEGLQV
jgi:hypothetical protein